jgi:hypothetical protein
MGGEALVAPVVNTTEGYTGAGVLDNAMSAWKGIERGDWAEGIANGAVGALGLLGAIADPLAAAISAGVGWVLEHCGPFREALDKLAGSPDVINSYAATWHNVSNALKSAAEELRGIVNADTAQWRSSAVDAYRGVAGAEAEMLMATGVAAAGVGSAVTMGGVVVATVRATVRDLIAEALGNIISKALQALTVVLIPKVVPEIIALVAKWSVRVASWLRKLVRVISRLAELCGKLKPVFTEANKLNDTVQRGYDGMLGKVPGLRTPALNPREYQVPGLAPIKQYPRNTVVNDAVTEGSKPVQE